LKRLVQKLLQRWRRCGGAAAETGAHDGTARTSERRVHTRAGVQDAATGRDAAHGPQQGALGRRQTEQETAAAWSLPMAAVGDGSVTYEARSGGGPGESFLADTGWSNGRWVCRKFQMLEDLPHHLAVRDGGGV
jgi:hypothetical protein